MTPQPRCYQTFVLIPIERFRPSFISRLVSKNKPQETISPTLGSTASTRYLIPAESRRRNDSSAAGRHFASHRRRHAIPERHGIRPSRLGSEKRARRLPASLQSLGFRTQPRAGGRRRRVVHYAGKRSLDSTAIADLDN